jgi:hypothetical protein
MNEFSKKFIVLGGGSKAGGEYQVQISKSLLRLWRGSSKLPRALRPMTPMRNLAVPYNNGR